MALMLFYPFFSSTFLSLLLSNLDYELPIGWMQDDVDAKIVIAGLSTTCSQKIHNQLVCTFLYFNSFF